MKQLYKTLIISAMILMSYPVVKAQTCLTTVPPLAGGNGYAAVTFNVKAYTALTVTEIWNSFYTGSWLVNVYYKTDSMNTSSSPVVVSTTTGWTLLASSVSLNVTTGAAGSIQQIPYTFNLAMPAGSVYAFCVEGITSSSTTPTSMYYTNVTTTPLFYNADMHINTSTNVGWGGVTAGLVNNGRMFNGKVCYTTAPPCTAPSGAVASLITSSSATLTWGTVPSSQGYEYVLDQVAGNPTGSGIATSATSYGAAGLNPNTTYYMHVRNKCGTTTFSSWVTTSFITLNAPVTCPSPGTLTMSGLTSSMATFNWNAQAGATGYEYKVDQIPTGPTSGWSTTNNTNTTVTGLSSNTSYYFHVRTACTGPDRSAWLNYAFTSLVCNKPVSVLISNISETDVDLMWSLMPNASSYDYAVDFSNQNPTTGIQNTTAITKHLSSLIPNSKYYLHVRSRCFATDASDWRLDSFITKFECYAPAVQVNYLGTNNPYAYWQPVPTAVAYEYGLTNSDMVPAFGATIYTTNIATLNLPNDGKDYYLHVRTKCNSMFTFSQWATVALRTGTTGIHPVRNDNNIRLYPNPAQNTLYLDGATEGNSYTIYDMTGRMVINGTVQHKVSEINTTGIAPGIYMLKLEHDLQVLRFIKE